MRIGGLTCSCVYLERRELDHEVEEVGELLAAVGDGAAAARKPKIVALAVGLNVDLGSESGEGGRQSGEWEWTRAPVVAATVELVELVCATKETRCTPAMAPADTSGHQRTPADEQQNGVWADNTSNNTLCCDV